jgi:hypothetical protein
VRGGAVEVWMENLLPRVVAGVDADFEAPALEGMRGRVTCVFVSAAVHLSCGNGGGVTAVNCHARTANMNTPARGGGVVPVHTFVARIGFVEILDTRSYSRTKVQCL